MAFNNSFFSFSITYYLLHVMDFSNKIMILLCLLNWTCHKSQLNKATLNKITTLL